LNGFKNLKTQKNGIPIDAISDIFDF